MTGPRVNDPADLERLIEKIDAGLAALPQPGRSLETRHEYHKAARDLIERLSSEEGARIRRAAGGDTLRLAGVATSCTHGDAGLLRNWLTAARRRLAAAEQ